MTDYSKLDREWCEEVAGRGDGVTRTFTGSFWPRPAFDATAYIVPGGILDALIPLEDREPVPPDQFDYNPFSGLYTLQFKEPPPERSEIWVRWRFPVPRLRGCLVHVLLQDGKEEWVTLEELSDAMNRR